MVRLVGISFLILLLFSACNKETTGLKTSVWEKVISPENKRIQYSGRMDFTNPSLPQYSYPAVRITFRIKGTGVRMLLKDLPSGSIYSGYDFLNVYIDKWPAKIIALGKDTAYTLASGLTDGEHTISVSKRTEGLVGTIQFLGLQMEKGTDVIDPPASNKIKLEFIGNSLTCGYGIESSFWDGFNALNENADKSFAAVTASKIGASYVLESVSGIGLFKSSGYGTEYTMNKLYGYPLSYKTYGTKWKTEDYIPDEIIIELGINDFLNGVDSRQYSQSYFDFIRMLRVRYKSTPIVLLGHADKNFAYGILMDNTLKFITEVLQNDGDDKIYSFIFSPQTMNGAGGHPDVANAQKMADELAPFIEKVLNK